MKIIERDGWIVEADESSSLISIGVIHEIDDPDLSAYTSNVFTDDDLLEMAVELTKVASYISNDPESVVKRLLLLIKSDSYLRSMKRD